MHNAYELNKDNCFPECTILDLPQRIMEALFLLHHSFHLLFQSSIFCLHLPAFTVYDSVTLKFCFVLLNNMTNIL